jgi:hypothetical protein
LVRSMIGVLRGYIQFAATRVQGERVVKFSSSQGFQLSVVEEDWSKVLPFLRDGTFTPMLNPIGHRDVQFIDPRVAYSGSFADNEDFQLYLYMLGTLEPLFPEFWPTSNI